MPHDEVLAYGGTATSDGINAFVYWYPNSSAEDDECKNEMTDALKGALSDLLSYGAIDYWEIGINYDHPNLADDSLSEFRNSGDDGESFKGWLKDQGYWDYYGVHVGVSENFDDTGGTEGLQGRYTNFAVQEPVHQFINYSEIEGTYLADSGNNQHEHDLGEVTSNFYLTPMATLYWDTHAQHGYCAEEEDWWGDYTDTITWCTKEAVEWTADDEDSNC